MKNDGSQRRLGLAPTLAAVALLATAVGVAPVGFARDHRPQSVDELVQGSGQEAAGQDAPAWDVTAARGRTRTIDFETREGTWMSVDISPDGRWIVFDLLGHIYRVSADGGAAECLTQNSGVAVNYQPSYSPDGTTIAFVSDRTNQPNLWLMDSDGSNPRAVFRDDAVRVAKPAWTPDGQYILVQRRPGGIWMYHREGGDGISILGDEFDSAGWPSVSLDSRYLYFDLAKDVGLVGAVGGARQIRRAELSSGEVIKITAGIPNTQIRLSSGGGYAAEISPNGRWLAFARRIPNGTVSFKGHRYGPRTALWLRDLQSGVERLLMDPIENDRVESRGWDVLPGYSWDLEGRSIVISQGGKIRRVDVASGEVSTVPFTASVHRVISERAYAPFRIDDEPFDAKFLRWHTLSPDGSRLAFEAAGRIWVMDRDPESSLQRGEPRRLTPESFEPFELSPAWSPDGRFIAFTSADEAARGHVWKASVEGGAPEQLTETEGEYLNPVWSPSGRDIVAVQGSGVTSHGRGWMFNPYYQLVNVSASGGSAPSEVITMINPPSEVGVYGVSRRSITQPSFGPAGRVYFAEDQENADGDAVVALVSVRRDGGDERVHMTFPYADEIAPSPDGRWVAFQEGDNAYITAFPAFGTGGKPPQIEKRHGNLPVRQVSFEGGMFLRWRSANELEFGSGNRHHLYRVDTREVQSTEARLKLSRRIPDEAIAIALTGARIVTLDGDVVIDSGTVVVRGSRIVCVGECVLDVDRVVDVTGTTIIPGFIDMHAHHHRETRGVIGKKSFEAAVYLAYGVTTDLDNSMWSQNIFTTAELVRSGAILGPRTFSTGPPLYRGDAFRQNEISSYEVAEQNIRRLQSWGAVSLKQYMQPRRDQRQWISDVARKVGLMVTSEGGDLNYNLGMIMDGQTGWEHPLGYLPLYSDVTTFFGRAEATYSVTFGVGFAPWNENYWYAESNVWEDEKLMSWMPWRTILPHARRRPLRPATDYSFPYLAQAVADIIEAGGHGAIGAHGQGHGIAPHWEVWMAASAMGPLGALKLASQQGAYFLGVQEDLGSIEVGKLADLLVLRSNPLDDIRNTADIRYVMQGGILFEAETLDEVWPEQRPYGARPWMEQDALRADDRPIDYWDRRQ